MARTITLKYSAECADCGAHLETGTRARYYGRGRVYGTACHEDKTGEWSRRQSRLSRAITRGASPGQIASIADPNGAYTASGRYLGSTGPRCEDAPCCGCCS